MPATDKDPSQDNHDARIEYLERAEYETRHAKVRRNDKRLLVCYVILVITFIFTTWLAQRNADALKYGLYDACTDRVAAALAGNQLRDVFIQAIATAPSARPPGERADLINQLKGVLFLPLEDCGKDPRS